MYILLIFSPNIHLTNSFFPLSHLCSQLVIVQLFVQKGTFAVCPTLRIVIFLKLHSILSTHKKRVYINIFSVFRSNLFSTHLHKHMQIRVKSFIYCLFSFNLS